MKIIEDILKGILIMTVIVATILFVYQKSILINLGIEKTDKIIEEIDEGVLSVSDWKIYRNEEYGFEFKYPESYTLLFENDFYSEETIKSNQAFDNLSLISITSDISMDIISPANIKSYDNKGYEKEELLIGSKYGLKYITDNSDGKNLSIFIAIDKENTLLMYSKPNSTHAENLISILSTLTILDNIDTSTWKTYTNIPNKYSFQYPENWILISGEDMKTNDEGLLVYLESEDSISAKEEAYKIYGNAEKNNQTLAETGYYKVYPKTGSSLYFSFYDNLEDFIKNGTNEIGQYSSLKDYSLNDNPMDEKVGEMIIANIDAYEMILGGGEGSPHAVLFEHNGIFNFTFPDKLTKIHKQILSTFKFVE